MDGVSASAFANVFVNNLIVIYAGAVCVFLGLNRFFPLRSGKTWPFWGFFLVKCSLWASFDASSFLGIGGGVLQACWVVVVAVLSIATYAILYAVWESSVLKVGLVSVLVDSLGGFTTVVAMATSNLLFTGEVAFEYVGYLGPRTFATAACQIAIFLPLFKVLSPICRFICDFKFKRERAWTVILMTILVLVASTKTKGIEDSVDAYFMTAILAIMFVAPHVLWRGHMARRQRMILARTKALTQAYDDSLRNQVEFLAKSKQLLDELASRMDAAGHDVDSAAMAEHLKSLRKTCDTLRYGTYSDNPALDVMLVSWEERFRALGVSVEYRIAPMVKSGAQAAFIVQVLFEWVFRECADSSTSKGRRSPAPDKLVLRVFRSANQLLVDFRLSAWTGRRFPRTWVVERMPSQALSLREFGNDQQRSIRIIVEEDSSWKS